MIFYEELFFILQLVRGGGCGLNAWNNIIFNLINNPVDWRVGNTLPLSVSVAYGWYPTPWCPRWVRVRANSSQAYCSLVFLSQ